MPARVGRQPDVRQRAADGSSADFVFVIPAGAAEAFRRGHPVNVLPAQLTMRIGQTIRLVSHDSESNTVGPYQAPPYATVTQRLTKAGEFHGQCTLHRDGRFVMIVTQ